MSSRITAILLIPPMSLSAWLWYNLLHTQSGQEFLNILATPATGGIYISRDTEVKTLSGLSCIASQHTKLEKQDGKEYLYISDYKAAGGAGNELKWRMAQSVAAALLCESVADKWRAEETID